MPEERAGFALPAVEQDRLALGERLRKAREYSGSSRKTSPSISTYPAVRFPTSKLAFGRSRFWSSRGSRSFISGPSAGLPARTHAPRRNFQPRWRTSRGLPPACPNRISRSLLTSPIS